MQLYNSLPATNYSWTTTSIDSLKRLQGPKQRLELVRLGVFTAIELSVHVAATAVKFAAALIQVPLSPLLGGVKPRVALIDAGAHLARSSKLAAALFAGPVLGLVRPEWTVNLYQRFSIVKEPRGHFASLCRLGARVLAPLAFVQAALAIRNRYFSSTTEAWLRIPLWAGISGGVVGTIAVIALAIRCVKVRGIDKLGTPVSGRAPLSMHSDLYRHDYGRVLAMRAHEGHLWVLQQKAQDEPWLRHWGPSDQHISSSPGVTAFTLTLKGHLVFSKEADVTCMKTLSDGDIAIGDSNGGLRIQSPVDNPIPRTITSNKFPINTVDRLKNGKFIISVVKDGADSSMAVITDNTDASLSDYNPMPNKVSVIRESPSGHCMAVNGPDGTVIMLAPSESPQYLWPKVVGTEVTAIEWLSDERLLTGDNKGTLRLWNTRTGALLDACSLHVNQPIYAIKRTAEGAETSSYDGQTRGWTIKLKQG